MSREPDEAGTRWADVPAHDRQPFDTNVAHSAQVHDYWLGGKDHYAADPYGIVRRLMAAVPAGSYLALSQVASDIEAEQMAEAARRYNRLAHETQRHRTHAEIERFFDGLDLVEPGLVAVQNWRPGSEFEATAASAMWGGVGYKPAQ